MPQKIFPSLIIFILAYIYISAPVKAETISMTLTIDGAAANYQAEALTLLVNGMEVKDLDDGMPPLVLDGEIYLPASGLFTMLGASVSWNDGTGMAYINYDGKVIGLRAKSTYVNVDGILTPIALPPKNVNGRLMVPVSFISDIFEINMGWSEESRVLTIDNGGSAAQIPQSTPYPGYNLPPQTPRPSASVDYSQIFHTPDPGPGNQVIRPAAPATTPPLQVNAVQEDPGYTAIDINAAAGPETLELSIDAAPDGLPAMEGLPKADILGIEYDPANPNAFMIKAASAITKVDKFLLFDNRLVVDIYNAEKIMAETEITVPGAALLKSIRVGQNQTEPELVTRVVFDLLEPVSFSVSFSENRDTVVVSFLRNPLTDVSFTSDGSFDYIRIKGDITPVVNVFPQTVNETFIIDIPLGIAATPLGGAVNGVFATAWRLEQFSPAMARIVLDMKDTATYSVSHEGTTTVVRLFKPTYQNLAYDSGLSRLTIPKNPAFPINIAEIVHNDQYMDYEYSFTLPGDFGALLGQGDYVIKDRFINMINITSVNGKTVIRFHEQRAMAFEITEDAANIYINAMLPGAKHDRIVVIDPGHGGTDGGTNHNGILEKELDLDIAKKLAQMLENAGIKVYMTRTDDTYPTRDDRAMFANQVGDLFISIHLNSTDGVSEANGTEVYYYPHQNDGWIGISGENTARIIQKNIVKTIGSYDRGYKENNYRVLVITEVPAVLCEFGFITNPREAGLLKTNVYREQCALGVFNGVMEVFQGYKPARP